MMHLLNVEITRVGQYFVINRDKVSDVHGFTK